MIPETSLGACDGNNDCIRQKCTETVDSQKSQKPEFHAQLFLRNQITMTEKLGKFFTIFLLFGD